MGDPFKHVQPGEGLSIPATAWNTMLDVARATATGASPAAGFFRQATVVRVKNETGSELPRNSILGLGDPIFTPPGSSDDAFLREVTFRGQTPDIDTHRRKFCVILDPAPVDAVVRAYVAGVCQAKVDLVDHSHGYAGVVDAETGHLESSRYGFAQILWIEADEGAYAYAYDSGVMWAVVRLGAHCPSVAIGKANGAISPRVGATFGSGSVDLYQSSGGPSVENIAVLNASNSLMTSPDGIDSGTWCSVAWDMDGTAWVAPLECQADAYS